jgi:hypothetical protein
MIEFSKYLTSWQIALETMTGNVAISEVDALTYVLLSKEGKHMPYEELAGATECVTP